MTGDAIAALFGAKTEEARLGADLVGNALVNLELLAQDKRKGG
jgi:hypothetical protein